MPTKKQKAKQLKPEYSIKVLPKKLPKISKPVVAKKAKHSKKGIFLVKNSKSKTLAICLCDDM